jgi:hypothetical protein
MAGDDGFAYAHHAGSEVFGTDALQADPRAFEHKIEFVSEQLRLRQSCITAELRQAFPLGFLEFFTMTRRAGCSFSVSSTAALAHRVPPDELEADLCKIAGALQQHRARPHPNGFLGTHA